MASTLLVFADTNVLVSALERNVWIELACADAISLHWSEGVFVELRRTLIKFGKEPNDTDALLHAMNLILPHAMVAPISLGALTIALPHANDHHVLAAALAVPCAYIVTSNLRHFPNELLATVSPPIRALSSDDLVVELLTANPTATLPALDAARRAFKAPPISVSAFPDALARAGLKQTADLLRHLSHG